MKIIEIIPDLSSGGAERFVVDLSNQLVELGCDVTLVTLFNLSSKKGLDFYLNEVSPKISLVQLGKKEGIDFKLFSKIKSIIDEIQPDIVHSHLRVLPYLDLVAFNNKRNIGYFHTIHNDAKKEASDLFNNISRKILFRSGKVFPITISKESDNSFSNFYGKTLARKIILNGSPLKCSDLNKAPEVIASRNKGRKVLVNIARLSPQKNLSSLVRAMTNHPDIDLMIIGDDTSDFANEIKKNAPENVYFLGQKPNPRDYMAGANAFILPSNFEGMPITLIECFSVGCIPIVTPVGGMINMVKDGYNGIVSTDTSITSISNAISKFLNLNNKALKLLSKHSTESFQHYDIKTCAYHYLNLFYNIQKKG